MQPFCVCLRPRLSSTNHASSVIAFSRIMFSFPFATMLSGIARCTLEIYIYTHAYVKYIYMYAHVWWSWPPGFCYYAPSLTLFIFFPTLAVSLAFFFTPFSLCTQSGITVGKFAGLVPLSWICRTAVVVPQPLSLLPSHSSLDPIPFHFTPIYNTFAGRFLRFQFSFSLHNVLIDTLIHLQIHIFCCIMMD